VGISAIIGAWYIDIPLEAVMIQLTSGVNKFSLLAIPFFILAGAIMAEGGIARRLVNFAYIFVGFIRGGLSLVNIVASTFFGAISGSSVADTASIGSVMIPEMDKKGYPRDFAAAVTASGSVQAILTPPSHNSVIYSLATGGTVSIAALFIAGILPGLLLSFSLMVMCVAFAHKRGYPKGERVPFRQALKIFVDTLWGLMTVVIIMGGILSGIFTATESAAIACLWAFFVTMFIYRDYKWSELPKLMFRTVKTVTIVMILIGFAAAFGAVMTYMQLPMRITEAFTSISDNKYVILMCINIMLLLIGTLMDMAPLILILTPVLLPVTNALGIDPVHFGMIMLVNLGIGLITPPVGSVLFVASAVSKQKIEQVVKAMLPFYAVLFLVLMLVTYIPAISLFLPKLFGVM
jgi:tripartite ATP-independent transporter DctM subunit